MIKNLIIRSISGLVMASILIGALYMTEISGFIILALIGIVSTYEFLTNIKKSGKSDLMVYYTCISGVLISLLLFVAIYTRENNYLALIAPLIITRFSVELFRAKSNPFESISYELFALIYVLLPMLLLTQVDGIYVIALFLLVWANDVGAYLIGVTLGKHRLCERLSPKKSWEGFWGGLAAAAGMATLISYYLDANLIYWTITGVVIALCAVAGDLFESMFKRSISIKDSGNMIPGHGGILDRFDAMFFAAPFFYMIYTFILRG